LGSVRRRDLLGDSKRPRFNNRNVVKERERFSMTDRNLFGKISGNVANAANVRPPRRAARSRPSRRRIVALVFRTISKTNSTRS
jgi:hypothetical protein